MSRSRDDIHAVLSRSHLPVLDGFRAVAVMTVVADHIGFVPHWRGWILYNGGMGVSGFFVLSGFLITWLLLREHEKTGRISLRDFYVRRMLRIWPAYYVVLLLSYLLRGYLHREASPGSLTATVLSAATFTYNYYKAAGGDTHLAIHQLWTVSTEEQFYFLWPALLIVLLRHGRLAALRGLGVIVTIVLGWRCLLWFGLGAGWTYIYHAFDTRLDDLAMGCLLGLATQTQGFSRFAKTVSRSPLMPLLPLAVLVANDHIGKGYHWTVAPTVEGACMLLLIVQLLQLYSNGLWSWLEHPATKYVGVISYSIYLYQYLGLEVGHDLKGGHGLLTFFILGTASTIAMASASYYLVERPFLRLRRRFTPPRAALAP